MDDTADEWPEKLRGWQSVIDDCQLTLAGFGRRFEIAYTNLSGWFFKGVMPNKKSKQIMEQSLSQIKNEPRIPYSPVWGYATPEQVARLKASIPPYERRMIMEQIEKQTRLKGKID